MVADDEQAVLDGAVNRIEHMQSPDVAAVHAFLNARDALDFVRQSPCEFYLILADIRMPGMSGLDLIRHVMELGVEARAIVLSAHSDFTYAQEAVHLGADEYLLKPVRMEQFRDALLRSLGRFPNRPEHAAKPDASHPAFMPGSLTLEESIRYIQEHLDQVDLATLANHTDLNYSYFSETFKKAAGKTFSQVLIELKMRAALNMLREGRKVADVTDALGYRNPKNFTRAFKRYYGASPSRWRSVCRDQGVDNND
jgi:YesN/AraC family two-component response regulator